MYNIQVHVPYEKQQYIKKINRYILNSISPSPHPCPHWRTHTRARTNMKQVAVGMYKSIGRFGRKMRL